MNNKKLKTFKIPLLEIIEIKNDEIVVTSGETNSFGNDLLSGPGYKL